MTWSTSYLQRDSRKQIDLLKEKNNQKQPFADFKIDKNFQYAQESTCVGVSFQ